MRMLVTGADGPLGTLAVSLLKKGHDLTCVGRTSGEGWPSVDLRDPETVRPLVADCDAIVHLDPFGRTVAQGKKNEQDLLDLAAQGTYVLLTEATTAGVDRVVLGSTLDFFSAYPASYVIDETWRPRPAPSADALGPYLAEQTCREFARAGGIFAICLRFGQLNAEGGTSGSDVQNALGKALLHEETPFGYRWQVFHVCSGPRFPLRAAKSGLNLDLEAP